MNASAPQPLFREEVTRHRVQRLHGEINMAIPVGWQLIGFSFVVTIAAVILFLSTASYGRVETVTGSIALDRGVAPIVPTRAGVVTAVAVREGQSVTAGAPLVNVRVEDNLWRGDTVSGGVLGALDKQDTRIDIRTHLLMRAAAADLARLAAQVSGLEREVRSVDDQIAAQQRLVEISEHALRDVEGVAGRGFISRRDLESRQSALLVNRQRLAELRQSRARVAADLAAGRQSMAQSAASAQAQTESLESDRAALSQQHVLAEASRGYTLIAPVAGTVTALTARPGQPAAADRPLLVVLPANARPLAEIYVPTSAIGFIEPGQEVRLAVDAFPFNRFGTVHARIETVSTATVPHTAPDGRIVPVYLVTARLREPFVVAFGRRQPLLPGMMFSARITTDRRTLLSWLFEPLYSVRGR